MEHIAIMHKSWGSIPKLASGQKMIESRWLKSRSAPWDKVKVGETVYFKHASESVSHKARVAHVLQFEDLTPQRIHDILDFYGEDIGFAAHELSRYEALFQDKRYCVMVFLEDIESVLPFHISKRDFGAMAAWISVPSVKQLSVSRQAPPRPLSRLWQS